mgnify:FL=1
MTKRDMVLLSGKTPEDLIQNINEWQYGGTHGFTRHIVQFDMQWVGGDRWVSFILFDYIYLGEMDTFETPVVQQSSKSWSFDHGGKTWTNLPTP